jgi:phage gp36-like protein
MAYTTEAIVRAQSPFKNSTNITSTYISRKIVEATSIIDSLIGSAYVLPLATVPEIIASIAETLTVLMIYREQSTNVEVEPGLNVEDAWNAQIELLKSIAKRELNLVDPATGIELTIVSSKRLGFYPNQASSDSSDSDSTAPYFTMNQNF